MRPIGSKYLLEEPLGRGATGTVWRARQRETAGAEAAVPGQPGETVAIKVLKEELANDADIVMRFLRERSVLLRLTHPNIVRTRDLVVEGDVLALVMDLVEGPDLHRYIRDSGPLTPVAAALLTAQIADALAASHADGVVHRDLKPANVLLAEQGGQMHPMLTDFGIARLADSPGLTRTHEFVGTPAYVAPESAEGRPQTSAVDIYGSKHPALRAGHRPSPFAGGTALEVLHRHLSEEPHEALDRARTPVDGHRALPQQGPGPAAERGEPRARSARGRRRRSACTPRPHRSRRPRAWARSSRRTRRPRRSRGPPRRALPTPPRCCRAAPGRRRSTTPCGATSVMPTSGSAGAADPTAVMPPVPPQPPQGAQSEEPHPWQSQLRAARDRNEQTQVQYLDPSQDPLRRRPQRQQPPQDQRPGQYGQQGGQGQQGQQGQQGRYGQQPPQPYQQQRPAQQRPQQQPYPPQQQHQPQQYAPPPAPQQYAQPQQQYTPPQPPPQAPAPREPRPPRQRSANPVRIPGLGCLKGCLVMIVLFVVAGWLVWELTPLQDWIAEGKGYWEAIGDGISKVTDWFSELGDSTGATGGTTGQ